MAFFTLARDDVAQVRHPALVPAEHLDAHDFLGAGVVGHVHVRVHLNHGDPRGLMIADL
jgi:hypothetical protein